MYYNGGGYTLTITGIGQWTCTAHALLPNPRRIVVEAGTFDPAQEISMAETWLVPGGGASFIYAVDWYAPGVGLVKREMPKYNLSTGEVSPGWWIHLTSYTVH